MKYRFESKGDWDRTFAFLEKATAQDFYGSLNQAGHEAVASLEHATPKDYGTTSKSWDFVVTQDGHGAAELQIYNTNVIDGFNVAIGLQYGHGTGGGGFVEGRDYINPAIEEPFDSAIEKVWEEVKR